MQTVLYRKGSVHLTKSYSLKMPYFLYEHQKQDTFGAYRLWIVFVFFRFILKASLRKAFLLYQAKSRFHLELDSKVQISTDINKENEGYADLSLMRLQSKLAQSTSGYGLQ